jgi:hypothetical protein
MRRALIALGALAAVTALTSPVGAQPSSRTAPSITRPVQLTAGDTAPTRTYGTPMIASDPEDPSHVIAVGAEFRSRRCLITRSLDGGQTWKQLDASPLPKEYPFCFITETGVFQGLVAFGRNHTLYFASPGWDVADSLSDWPFPQGGGWRGNVTVVLSKSTDLGDSWTSTIVRPSRGRTGADLENNRPVTGLAVDTSGPTDIVYVGWAQVYQDHKTAVVATSLDAGKTFSDPVNVASNYLDEAVRLELGKAVGRPTAPPLNAIDITWPVLTLDGKGTLYAVWHARGRPGPPVDDSATYLSRSTDRGKTFTVAKIGETTNTFINAVLAWSPTGGPDGTLHLAYHSTTARKVDFEYDVFYRHSTDGGSTWSDEKTLNDDDAAGLFVQVHPNMTVAPDGRVDVAWWDFRNDTGNFANDVYMTSSSDNGGTWTKNLRVTDQSVNRRIGPWFGNADIRQPPGLVSRNGYTLVVWDDTRNGDDLTQTQDVYGSTVQYETLGGGASSSAKYALAGVIGFSLVGLAFVIVLAATRRRAPAEASERRPVSVG